MEDQGRTQQRNTEEVRNLRGISPSQLGVQDGFIDFGDSSATPFHGPALAEITGIFEFPLRVSAYFDQGIHVVCGIFDFLGKGSVEMGVSPLPDLLLESLLFGCEVQVHAAFSYR